MLRNNDGIVRRIQRLLVSFFRSKCYVQGFRKFLLLSQADQKLLIRAALVLGGIRIWLWLLPFRILLHSLTRMTEQPTALSNPKRSSIKRISWAVGAASRFIPAATCL